MLSIALKKIFFKLMNNSVCGKTIDNLRKIIKARLVNNDKDYKKWVSRPSFILQKMFSRSFVAIHGIKIVSTLDKPIYVGFSILDLGKLLMYQFHYKYIGAKNGCDAKLSFTETDSLVYEIKAEDVYQDLFEDKSLFDFSDYFKDLQFYDPVNKKVIGKMKDEVRGKIINQTVGLKSNMYSLFTVDSREI